MRKLLGGEIGKQLETKKEVDMELRRKGEYRR